MDSENLFKLDLKSNPNPGVKKDLKSNQNPVFKKGFEIKSKILFESFYSLNRLKFVKNGSKSGLKKFFF